MSRKKNGFINLLFDDNESLLPFNFTKEHDCKLQQLNTIKKVTEEYMTSPKNRLKYIKIVKINDFVTVNSERKSRSKYRDKICVDGCQLTKILPFRQLPTQNHMRVKQIQRSYSPQAHSNRQQKRLNQFMNRSQFCQRENSYLQSIDLQNPQISNAELQKQQPLKLLMRNVQNGVQVCDFAVQNSTASSNRDFKPKSVRYRKISNFQKKQTINFNKNLFQTKRELHKHYTNPPLNPENITAKAYVVFEHFKQSKHNKKFQKCLHTALNSKINLEVASLTKIMTCLLTLQICESNRIDICTRMVKIGEFQTNVQGTKAQIQVGEIYTVEQLLYGLMLPSGNDASIALSVFCGEILENKRCQQKKVEASKDIKLKKYYYKKFILQMNKKCIELQMKRTFFANSHGLANNLNRSCAADLAILIDYALRNSLLRSIVGTKTYECSIFQNKNQSLDKNEKQRKILNKQRKIKWQNTHKFIHTKPQYYKGIKTGTTDVAGPCLASLIQKNNRQFIIIVLNSKNPKARYRDTQSLREWLFKKEQFSPDFNNE